MSREIADYIGLMQRQRAELLGALDGLPVAALDWTPLPEATSSLAMLAHHCAGVLRFWIVEGLTGQDTQRDRPAEFAARGQDAGALATLINAAYDEAEAALKEIDPAVLDEERPITLNHHMRGQVSTPRYVCLTLAINHVSEHVGHMQLTRQLWEARGCHG